MHPLKELIEGGWWRSDAARVFQVEHDVHKDKKQVGYVQNNNKIVVVVDLVYDARDVSEKDDDHKKQAFSFGPLGLDRGADGDWPTNAEASQHAEFEDTKADVGGS